LAKYQYETSPKKEIETLKPNTKKAKKANKNKAKAMAKIYAKSKRRTVAFCILAILALFAILYQYANISQTFHEIQKKKSQIAAIQKENEQIESEIQSGLNMEKVEQKARALGMQKLDASQTRYVSLNKQDYVYSGLSQNNVNDDKGFFTKIIDSIKEFFN
jgi:cell division protein FtsL